MVRVGQSIAHTATVPVRLIDADVHPLPKSDEELWEYMREPWRSRPALLRALRGRTTYVSPNGLRADAKPPVGRPGSDPDLLKRQVLGEMGVDYAILITSGVVGPGINPELNAAASAMVNDWLVDTWLTRYNHHSRYKGSISLPVLHPAAAVREIERWAGHPHVVQAWIPHGGPAPFGHPQFHPIWEAASRHGLPVAMHTNSGGFESLATPVGFLRTFLEVHAVGHALTYAANLVSLICEGVFAKYENFRFVFVEGGFSWVGPLIWRLDKNWRALRAEVPALTRLPSEYLRDQVRFTSQPIEEPENPRDLVRMFDLVDAERILMYASDYPHWDFDDPVQAFPKLPEALRRRIFCENARALYHLPDARPAEG